MGGWGGFNPPPGWVVGEVLEVCEGVGGVVTCPGVGFEGLQRAFDRLNVRPDFLGAKRKGLTGYLPERGWWAGGRRLERVEL